MHEAAAREKAARRTTARVSEEVGLFHMDKNMSIFFVKGAA